MIRQESIKKTFSNFFFCNQRDSCELVFSYGDGFATKQEAVAFIESIGISPMGFVYFLFKGTWYAVHLNSWQEELVFSKERMWIKYSSVIGAQTEVFDITKAEPAEIREKITFSTATMSGGWHCWNNSLLRDLHQINRGNIGVQFIGEGIPYENINGHSSVCIENAGVLLGCCLFDDPIPVFQLDVVNGYFNNDPKPAFKKLWKEGVVALDPFKNIEIHTEDGQPYYLNYWMGYLQTHNIPVGNMDPGACINFKSGAWKRGITNRVDSYEDLPMAKEYPLRRYGPPAHLLHSAVESSPEKEQTTPQTACKVIMFPGKGWMK